MGKGGTKTVIDEVQVVARGEGHKAGSGRACAAYAVDVDYAPSCGHQVKTGGGDVGEFGVVEIECSGGCSQKRLARRWWQFRWRQACCLVSPAPRPGKVAVVRLFPEQALACARVLGGPHFPHNQCEKVPIQFESVCEASARADALQRPRFLDMARFVPSSGLAAAWHASCLLPRT